jgi:arylsulfatase A-like enzyme
VIFTSDNGGLHVHEFTHSPATHNTPYRGGKGYLYEGGLREPMIVRWPGHLKPSVSEVPLSHLDLVPTLLALAGLPVPPGIDGLDQSAHWLGKVEPPPRKFYWHFPHYNNQGGRPSGAIRDGDWKYVAYYDTGRVELFNLKDDVSESHDLAATEVERAAAMHKLHAAWRKEIDAQENTPNPDFDPALFKRLYEDFDPSRPPLAPTAAAMEEQMKAWRALMNEVVRGSQNKKKKK